MNRFLLLRIPGSKYALGIFDGDMIRQIAVFEAANKEVVVRLVAALNLGHAAIRALDPKGHKTLGERQELARVGADQLAKALGLLTEIRDGGAT